MRTEKVSLTLETELLAEARDVVLPQLQHDRLTGLLAELKQEKGPIEPEAMEEVRRAWPAPGEKAARRRSA